MVNTWHVNAFKLQIASLAVLCKEVSLLLLLLVYCCSHCLWVFVFGFCLLCSTVKPV